MTSKEGRGGVDLIEVHKKAIDEELAALNRARQNAPGANIFSNVLAALGEQTDVRKVVAKLSVVINPRFVLVSHSGEYKEGDISATHEGLQSRWDRERLGQGLGPISTGRIDLVSGIGFGLKMDSGTKYVRLDSDSAWWGKGVPPFAKGLIDGGYVVLDARYKRINADSTKG